MIHTKPPKHTQHTIFNPYFKTEILSSSPLHFKSLFPNDVPNTNLFCSLVLLTKAISIKIKKKNN